MIGANEREQERFRVNERGKYQEWMRVGRSVSLFQGLRGGIEMD